MDSDGKEQNDVNYVQEVLRTWHCLIFNTLFRKGPEMQNNKTANLPADNEQ